MTTQTHSKYVYSAVSMIAGKPAGFVGTYLAKHLYKPYRSAPSVRWIRERIDLTDAEIAAMQRGASLAEARAAIKALMSDADRLRAWLAMHGRTQRGLARELGISDRTVRAWCAGVPAEIPAIVWLALETLEKRPG